MWELSRLPPSEGRGEKRLCGDNELWVEEGGHEKPSLWGKTEHWKVALRSDLSHGTLQLEPGCAGWERVTV